MCFDIPTTEQTLPTVCIPQGKYYIWFTEQLYSETLVRSVRLIKLALRDIKANSVSQIYLSGECYDAVVYVIGECRDSNDINIADWLQMHI